MNRKHFLSAVITLGAAVPSLAASAGSTEATPKMPAYLKPGDRIGITSPAGYITLEELQPALQQLQCWGFHAKIGSSIGKRHFTFGGTDEERRRDFQEMLDDDNIEAILCARGGYGFIRIIDQLDFSAFEQRPKWIIGFSDITVLHAHLNHNYGIASIHSKMCNSFPDNWATAEPIQVETILSIRQALAGEQMKYSVVPNEKNKPGVAEGILTGGNLKTIETLCGSRSDLKTDGKLLFVEDTGEYLYSIDRMFWNLKRSGKLDKLAGLIVGGFKIKPDNVGEEFGKTICDIVLEKVTEFKYPVIFDFPVGHQKNNYALKCGVKHLLTVHPALCSLQSL